MTPSGSTERLIVAPFHALRYDASRVGDVGAVWAPPYDVISTDEAEALRRRHPKNIVRISLPEPAEADRYSAAASLLRAWTEEGTLVRDEQPAVYLHRHTFRDEEGKERTRAGVWALVRLVPLEGGRILPHERTLSGPKADRLALMRACRAQLSPVFVVASDADESLARALAEDREEGPVTRAEFPAGEHHEIRPLTGSAAEEMIAGLSDATLLIADGHHRYETALTFRDDLREVGGPAGGTGAHEFVLTYITSERDPGLLVLPTHRVFSGPDDIEWSAVLERAADRFSVFRVPESRFRRPADLLRQIAGRPAFVLVVRGAEGGWRVELADRSEDATIELGSVALHEIFLPAYLRLGRSEQEGGQHLTYTRDAVEAIRRVRHGPARAAALVAPPRIDQIRSAIRGGDRLPPKTTFFWPKVPTGPAVHLVDPGETIELVGGA